MADLPANPLVHLHACLNAHKGSPFATIQVSNSREPCYNWTMVEPFHAYNVSEVHQRLEQEKGLRFVVML